MSTLPLLAFTFAALPLASQLDGLNGNSSRILTNRLITSTHVRLESAQQRNVQSRPQMRFREMDRNGDGVITRDEWQGTAQSFRDQDWNGDAGIGPPLFRVDAYDLP